MEEEVNVHLLLQNFRIKMTFQKNYVSYSQLLNQTLDLQFMEEEVILTVKDKVLITSTWDNQILLLIHFIEVQIQVSKPYLNSVKEAQIFQIYLIKKIKLGILTSFIQDLHQIWMTIIKTMKTMRNKRSVEDYLKWR